MEEAKAIKTPPDPEHTQPPNLLYVYDESKPKLSLQKRREKLQIYNQRVLTTQFGALTKAHQRLIPSPLPLTRTMNNAHGREQTQPLAQERAKTANASKSQTRRFGNDVENQSKLTPAIQPAK